MNVLDDILYRIFVQSHIAQKSISMYVLWSLIPLPISSDEEGPYLLSESKETEIIDDLIKNLQSAKDSLINCDRLASSLRKKTKDIVSNNKKPFFRDKDQAKKLYKKVLQNLESCKEDLNENASQKKDLIEALDKASLNVKNAINFFNTHCDPSERIL